MNVELRDIIVAFVVSLPGLIGLFIQINNYRAQAKKTEKEAVKTEKEGTKTEKEAVKTEMEATDVLVDTAISLTIPLKEENKRLADRNKVLEKGARLLFKQVKDANIEPLFDPSNGNN